MKAMRLDDDMDISEINLDDPKNIVMVASRSGANIYLGTGDLRGKLWRLAKVVEAVRDSDHLRLTGLEKVDLRFGSIVPTKIRGG
jgi:hypothetical protein